MPLHWMETPAGPRRMSVTRLPRVMFAGDSGPGDPRLGLAIVQCSPQQSRPLSGSDPIAVSKHGRVIGFYVTLARDEDEVQRAVAKFDETVGQVLEESGLSETELAALFDLRGPLIQ